MNKKCIAEGALVMLIIALITSGVLGIFVYNYSQRQSCVQKVELCRTSITVLNALGFSRSIMSSEPKLDCPMCVPGSSAEIKNKKEPELFQEVAEHLRWCWHKTTGKDNSVGDSIGSISTQKGQAQTVCIVCSEFKTDLHIDVARFLDYLRTQKIMSNPGKGKTYAEYLDTTWGIDMIPLFPSAFDYVARIKKQGNADDVYKFMQNYEQEHAQDLLFQWPIDTNIQIIAFNWPYVPNIGINKPVMFNQLVMIPAKYVVRMPCDVYHYQTE